MLVNSLGNLKQNQTRHSKRAFKLTSVTSCILLKKLSWLKLPHTYSRCFLKSPKTTFSSQPHTLVCSCPFPFLCFPFPCTSGLVLGSWIQTLRWKKKNASLRNMMWRASFLVIDSYAMSCYHDAFSTFLLTNQHELGVFITQKLGMRRSRVNPRGNSSTYLFLKIIILLRNALVIMMAETYWVEL